MAKQDMLINYVHGEECRIAIVENQKLEELYTERTADDLHVGNIYRGRVTNVEPSIQAAFIDFGLERNGFLHISDLHPRYFPGEDDSAKERVGKKTPRRDRPPIQQSLKRGDEVLVQVLKEGIGTKGPTLTTYLSIPGRFLVMMPSMERLGVSRKIDDDDQRREMRKILEELDPPPGFGFIIRTAGVGRTKTELKRDLAYLQRLWRTIKDRMKAGSGPAELYRESDLVIRTIRDVLTNDTQRVIIDDATSAARAREFLRIAMPRGSTRVHFYDGTLPIFDAHGIEQQIQSIDSRHVPLPCGGSLVIDPTEALVAIDVNSGKFRDNASAEFTAYKTNSEAVDEICRQLRLRDLGGVVVLDLIDMYMSKHRREIERRLRELLKKDRARTKTTRISEFGIVEMTRQRMRPSLKTSLYQPCHHCQGVGHVMSRESVVLDVMRRLAVAANDPRVRRLMIKMYPESGELLINRRRPALSALEKRTETTVELRLDMGFGFDQVEIEAFGEQDVRVEPDGQQSTKAPNASELIEVGDDFMADHGDNALVEIKGEDDSTNDADDGSDAPSRPRRRRGGRKRTTRSSESAESGADGSGDGPAMPDEPEPGADAKGSDESDDGSAKPKRRRRRGGRKHRRGKAQDANGKAETDVDAAEPAEATTKKKPSAPRPRRRKPSQAAAEKEAVTEVAG
ncbi:MAG: ribonuclease E [Planctomycetaceae bacterium]|nr:ribonuclease E [Planctomycetaceae bacterium]